MPLGNGQVFAGYTIVRQLGSGGMGEVYLAQHPRLPRRDALKLLTGDITADPSFRERFLREANLASTLWHPHIVGVHDRGEHEGQLWISMDYVDGEDAGRLIARKYPAGMPVELATAIVTAVASALDYANDKGLLHRDVKPSNVLIAHEDNRGERRILLTDFGIARTVDDNSGLTDTNMTLGTVDYAAPEQLMGDDMDGRADQYSLAATAYYLLTGTPLFRDSNSAVVIGRHLNTDPPRLADARPELESLDYVMASALAKDPQDRFANCSDFASALSEQAFGTADANAPAAATAHALIQPHPKRAERPMPPKRLVPGWYPDPGGGEMLYWDGQGWHTAPLPKSGSSGGNARSPDRERAGPWLVVASIAVAAALIVVTLVFVNSQDGESPQPTTAPSTSFPEPTFSSTTRPRNTTTEAPSTTASPPRTETETVTETPQPPTVLYWDATIVGTCDEDDSCGVRQRVAPAEAAASKYPSVLRDGMAVPAVCHTVGEFQESGGYSSDAWYQLINGAYVNAIYTNLSTPPIRMPAC